VPTFSAEAIRRPSYKATGYCCAAGPCMFCANHGGHRQRIVLWIGEDYAKAQEIASVAHDGAVTEV